MPDNLTKAAYEANLNTTFTVCPDAERRVDLELVAVRAGRSSPRQEQFALLFSGPLDHPLGQGTWTLQHDKLGEFDLFLAPVDRDAASYYYEAVFNRLLPVAG